MFFRLILSQLLDKNQYICTDNPNLYHYGCNKIRTIANGYCPLSFRSVDSIDYKKAMLIFYEQNNIYAFKQIFIQQYRFAVKEYF